MMVSKETEQEKIVGVDMFIESSEQPEVIAQKCLHHGGVKFKLISISNRWYPGMAHRLQIHQSCQSIQCSF